MVARGTWPAARADRVLLQFAIPCLLAGMDGDSLPHDLRDDLASLRRAVRYPGGEEFTRTDAETRDLFALLHGHGWTRELGEAAGRASLRWAGKPDQESRTRAEDLIALCTALGITPCLPAAPAEPERIAA